MRAFSKFFFSLIHTHTHPHTHTHTYTGGFCQVKLDPETEEKFVTHKLEQTANKQKMRVRARRQSMDSINAAFHEYRQSHELAWALMINRHTSKVNTHYNTYNCVKTQHTNTHPLTRPPLPNTLIHTHIQILANRLLNDLDVWGAEELIRAVSAEDLFDLAVLVPDLLHRELILDLLCDAPDGKGEALLALLATRHPSTWGGEGVEEGHDYSSSLVPFSQPDGSYSGSNGPDSPNRPGSPGRNSRFGLVVFRPSVGGSPGRPRSPTGRRGGWGDRSNLRASLVLTSPHRRALGSSVFSVDNNSPFGRPAGPDQGPELAEIYPERPLGGTEGREGGEGKEKEDDDGFFAFWSPWAPLGALVEAVPVPPLALPRLAVPALWPPLLLEGLPEGAYAATQQQQQQQQQHYFQQQQQQQQQYQEEKEEIATSSPPPRSPGSPAVPGSFVFDSP